MVTIKGKKHENKISVDKGMENLEHSHSFGGNAKWKTVWLFLRNFKVELPYDPAIPLSGIYSKELEADFLKISAVLCS